MIDRYTRPQMGALFTEQHKFDTWLQVELAVCDAWAGQGAIPKDAVDRIRRKARFSVKRIEEIEATVNHDVIAFTSAVGESIGQDSAFFHKGLTSSDVVDTAQSLVLKQAGQLIEEGLVALKDALGKRALEHKHTPVMGRTHGVHAEPTTFGLRLLVWYDELSRHEERLAAAIDNLAVGKLSGAVGNFAHIPPAFEEQVLKKLGLQPAPVSNQVVQRDRHAQFVCALALLGATLEKIAINLRTLQRTELGEAQEPFAPGQKGSSAMPHKKNPILLERITGLARVLRGYAVTALENVALWDERDISHSGAERVILPDACILLDYMLSKLKGVIEQLEVRADRMERNIYLTKGLIFSQRVLLALTEAGLSREAAYAVVQRNAMRCWSEGAPLLDALLADRDARTALSAPQISALFTLEPYLAHVDEIFARVGLGVSAPMPAGRRDDSNRHEGDSRGGEPHNGEAQDGAASDAKRRRGRRGGKAVQAKRARQATPGLPVARSAGVVQNISERASDYYETAALTTPNSTPLYQQVDETLGESEYQRDARAKRGAKRQGGSQLRTADSRQTSSRGGSRGGSRGSGRGAAPPASSTPASGMPEPSPIAPAPAAAVPAPAAPAPLPAPVQQQQPVAEQPPVKPARSSRSRKPKSEAPADTAASAPTAPVSSTPTPSAPEPPPGAEQHAPDGVAAPKKRSRGTRGGSGRSRKPAEGETPPEA